ncbi:MAG: ABC transporter substrate-binding protein [Anaerolineae bacterium]
MTWYRRIGVFLIPLALLALVACGTTPAAQPPATTAPPATAAMQPTTAPQATAAPTTASTGSGNAANTLIINRDLSDMISLDPGVGYEFSDDLITHNVYETLVRFEGADLSTLKPGLATTWDTKDAGDHTELTFHLRSGAKFSSGNPVTADDVVYSFQRVISLNKSPAFLFTDDSGLKQDSVKATDPQTVVISLPKTSSVQGFLAILTFSVGSIVDSKTAKAHDSGGDFGTGWLLDHSAGSGPYNIDHWTKQSEVLLTANPNYDGGTKPALKQVLLKHVAESATQQAALEKGDIDIANNLSPEQFAAEKGKPGVQTVIADSTLLVYIGMNVTVKPLDNANVREAIRTAIDYDGIIQGLLGGNAKKVQAVVPSGFLGFNPATPFQQDITKAKSLLQQSGVSGPITLELLVPTGSAPGGVAWADLAAKVKSDLDKIGVTVNIKQTTQADLLGSYRAQKGQLVMILWGPDFPDPDANVTPFTDYAAKSIAYRNAWNDATIAQKAHAAALMTDTTQRTAAYKDITEYVLHNGPYSILYQSVELIGLRSNVKGLVWSPIGWTDFATVSK